MSTPAPSLPHFAGLPGRRAHFLQDLAGLAPAFDANTGHEDALRVALGFVPPCRGAASPETLAFCPAHQLLTASLLIEHGAAAVEQGMAARRAGVARGDEFLTALAEREREERDAGAVAAYG